MRTSRNALGLGGLRVSDPANLVAALRSAKDEGGVIDVIVSRDAVSSDAQKGLAEVPDYQALSEWDALERGRRTISHAAPHAID